MYRFDAADFVQTYKAMTKGTYDANGKEYKDGHLPGYNEKTCNLILDAVDKVNQHFLSTEGPHIFREDNADTIFFARQLEFIETQLYPVDLAVLKYRKHIPVDNQVDPGAEYVTYRQYEPIGMAQIIASYASDLPRFDIVAQEYTATVKPIGGSIGYSVQDIRKARFANIPLETFKMASAERGFNEKENQIAWFGEPVYGLYGIFNNPNIPLLQVPVGATTGVRYWAPNSSGNVAGTFKTPDEIIADVALMVATIKSNTKLARQGNTGLLPVNQYTKIATTPRATFSDTTILNFIMANKAYGINEFDDVLEMQAPTLSNGVSSSDVCLFYQKAPDVLQQRIPLERMMHPMQWRNLEFLFPMESRHAGVVIRYPIAMLIFYGM